MTIEQLFGELLRSRDVIHLAHLKTTSYAKHKALKKYYNAIVDMTDTLIESYQGEFGLVTITIDKSQTDVDAIKYLKLLLQVLNKSDKLFTSSDYINLLDNIKTLIKQTLYKLTYLE